MKSVTSLFTTMPQPKFNLSSKQELNLKSHPSLKLNPDSRKLPLSLCRQSKTNYLLCVPNTFN